jgi:fibronectin-binding autotransporter adhesin
VQNSGVISGGASTTATGGIGVSGTGLSLTNLNGGLVTGGNSPGGVAGVGVSGSGLAVVNDGTIEGGLGSGAVRANAVQFTGGANVLQVQAGSTILGNVVAFSAADKLQLGGATNASFDVSLIGPAVQYRGFGLYEKVGASTWTLSSTTSAVTPWTVAQGTLSVSSDANLGAPSGGLTFDGGALATTADITSARTATITTHGGAIDVAPTTTFTMNGTISGAGALTKTDAGALVLTGADTYGGGTLLDGGKLTVGNDLALGSGTLSMANNTTLSFLPSNFTVSNAISITGVGNVIPPSGTAQVLAGVISDGASPGTLVMQGPGTLALAADNTYRGGTTISAGTLQLGDGGTSGSIVGNVADNGALAFDRSDTMTFGGAISGSGAVAQIGAGTTILTGANSYLGATTVGSGALYINGNQSAATGATGVASGATLGGTGTIGGDATVAGGGVFAPGGVNGAIGTLTINGDLTLNSGAVSNYRFGQAGVPGGPLNDLANVGGNLTLGGTLNVTQTPGGSFLPGLYRIFNYSGALTDNGLSLGDVPPATTELVQTSVANQVNLINTTGLTLNVWDGAAPSNKDNGVVEGGDGVWQNSSGNDNWTTASGAINAPTPPAASPSSRPRPA